MPKTAKVAVTVDQDLLRAAEKLRERTHESRSGLFSRALRRLLQDETHRRARTRYIQAHRDQPETPSDVEWTEQLAAAALSSVPWEDGDE